MTETHLDADVGIVGAGPAGSAAAMAAVRAGATVMMVHRDRASRLAEVERLAPRATALLSDLELLRRLDVHTGFACPGVRSQWGPGRSITRRAIFDPYGGGWTVDRARFDELLRQQAVAQGTRIVRGAVTLLARSENAWQLTVSIEEGETATFRTRCIVLTSGRDGWLARQVGAVVTRAAREVAVLASFDAIGAAWAEDPLLLVEGFPGGWAYGLPAPGGGALAGICVSARRCRGAVQQGLRAVWEGWHAQTTLLREAVGFATPCCLETRSAHSQRRWPVIGPGWALAGDAACAPSPLSGHGVTFALESGRLAGIAMYRDDPAGFFSYARWVRDYWADHERESARLYGAMNALADPI